MKFTPKRYPAALPLGLAVIAVILLAPISAGAHAFGVRYDLPLPMWMFLIGAGAAVALSFLGISRFIRNNIDLEQSVIPVMGPGMCRIFAWVIRIVGGLLFAFVLATAFVGVDDTFHNFAPLFVWVNWWVGMAFASALLGNIWAVANPWRSLFDLFSRSFPTTPRPYPEGLGYWPATILFIGFAWCELISSFGESPRTLGWLIVGYSLITWSGMATYGRDAWCRHGEIFSVVFGLFARFAPLAGRDGRLILRFPGAGLAIDRPFPISMSIFILTVLTTVTFDGVLETPAWALILDWISESSTLRPTLLALQDFGFDLLIVIKTIGLVSLIGLFALCFSGFILVVKWVSDEAPSLGVLLGWFIPSIVPIAIAYHLSHYVFYLMTAGQQIISVISDPFGWGWDLFGTVRHQIDLGVVTAEMVWYLALAAIVLGHMFSVLIAHIIAFRAFDDAKSAIRSQYPMIFLMVGYTMLSLWILSQPIIAD